jgi:hypothetical protein
MPRWRKLKDVRSRLFPVLTYASETWALKAADYRLVDVFINKVRLAVLNRARYTDGITMTNEDLKRRVLLPSAVELLLPKRIAFLLRLSRGSCEIARKSLWMEVEEPGAVNSGVTSGHNPRVLRSELQYISKHSEDLVLTSSGESDAVWKALLDCVSQSGYKAAAALVKRACKAGKAEVPSLRAVKTLNFPCTHENCHLAYSERKYLNRHLRQAHQTSVMDPTPVVPVDPCTKTTESAVVVKVEDSTLSCTFCQKVYKRKGFLLRHLKTVHMVAEGSLPAPEAPDLMTPSELAISRSISALQDQSQSSRGLTCHICGKGASKGRVWGEKTLTNHMAKEHKVNLKTGEKSRQRNCKEIPAK